MSGIVSLLLAPLRALGRLFGGGGEDADTPPEAATPEAAAPGVAPRDAPRETGVFVDMARGRSVAYRLYRPDAAACPAPVVLFSHGMGGSVDAAPYLGRALAEAGYWGVFIQHQGSDEKVLAGAEGPEELREAFAAASSDPQTMANRFEDVSFVIDELERQNAGGGLFGGAMDLDRVGLAGHSFGARTVLALAGQAVGAVGPAFKDVRIRAGLALSPSGGRGPFEDDPIPPDHFAMVDIPILHVTGTLDAPSFRSDDFDPFIRTLPFQHIPADDQYLLVLDGARHDDFSGTGRGHEEAPETRYTLITAEVALLFFDAYLKGSETAWANLRAKMPEFLAPVDYFEFR